MRFPYVVLLSACALMLALPLLAQSPNGVINGLVGDPSNRVIVGADVVVVNDVTGVQYTTKTNGEGIYVVPSLPPGPYRLQVSKVGFKTLIKPDIVLNVQDALSINFTLPVGALYETMTVEGGAPLVNTESAAVSTVVDRQFAENLPMNGRSFQALIELTPGVVLTASNSYDSGQFSVNGQRADANYWMVDGVSANIGVGASPNATGPGNGLAGSLGSFSVQGGTNSLVSVDALQEFRIQTSTYAPEFGRTPGGQISIVTRSGANKFNGTAFDYLRNDFFDANNWFNGYTNDPPLPKAEERQNDFGGTFSGPILKDRTFFFFSYEGLRLRLPQTALTTVPDVQARQSALPALQPYFNAYPLPTGPSLGNGIAEFNASFSNSSALDAYSLRIDHRLNNKLTLFGRYNYSPSETDARGAFSAASLSTVNPIRITTQTATAGATWSVSAETTNDLRLNYSRTNASSHYYLDNFGGAVPLTSAPFPSPYTDQNAQFQFDIFPSSLFVGQNSHQLQRQVNLVDNLAMQRGSHSLKYGVDFRRLSPLYDPQAYTQIAIFLDVPSAESGKLFFSQLQSARSATILFRNLGVFAQDTWRIIPRLTVTYGLRWDVDFAPSSINGPSLAAATGFNLNNLSSLALAPSGTPVFKTPYGNLAPRLGVAYQLSQSHNWRSVVRGGFGVFYDLATSEVGNALFNNAYPFGAFIINSGGTFPLDSATAAPPPITFGTSKFLPAFDPNLKLPYTLQWNVALEEALGHDQSITASYIGSAGRRLIQTAFISAPNPNIQTADLVLNAATSDYDAFQLQFQRRLWRGLQTLASYTWSHSIDTASAGSALGSGANALVPSDIASANRGPSDFDIRNAFSAGVTYDVPVPKVKTATNAILGGWSLQSVIQARSAPPVNVYYSSYGQLSDGFVTSARPDLVPGQPLHLRAPQYPGGMALNPSAFTGPPTDPNTGLPLRQGDLPRNALRGFGATQWDFAVHRDFHIHESLRLQFRAEMFNLLNHPNFGPPNGDLFSPQSVNPLFGLSTAMLGTSLGGGNFGGGGFDPLYQVGGPRSIEFAMKLIF
jgi:hypothetical protein